MPKVIRSHKAINSYLAKLSMGLELHQLDQYAFMGEIPNLRRRMLNGAESKCYCPRSISYKISPIPS
ncbi:MAG: hypothetical protein ACE5GU_11620 [Candidatus Scalinduaceae bacterium]